MDEMLKFFIERTENDFAELHRKIDHVSERVDELWSFKMKMVGVFAAVSGFVSMAVTLFTLYLRSK